MRSVLDSAERKDIEEMGLFKSIISTKEPMRCRLLSRELTSRDESSLHLLEL